MRMFSNLTMALAASMAVGPIAELTEGRKSRQHRPQHRDPAINRHTGQPHTHAREIARRLRQQGNLK